MLVPPPDPPTPALSLPVGEMASAPAPPLEGIPTFGPGCAEITAPAFGPLPPLVEDGAADPVSIGAPNPGPMRPSPEPDAPDPPPTDGGGGTTLLASSFPLGAPAPPPVVPVPPPAPAICGGGGTMLGGPKDGAAAGFCERAPAAPEIPEDGGGAITFGPAVTPAPWRMPCGVPPAAFPPTDGGGGTTFDASVDPAPRALFEFTDGGGATTSLGPKIFPIKLLSIDPLPACAFGGGGTTAFVGSALPLGSRCISCVISVEGGGAITDGAGRDTFACRVLARSGADAGGGTTSFVICTGALRTSRLTAPGAGGITFAASDGEERVLSRDALGAGAITEAFIAGAVSVRSRATFGAGGITDGASAGATRACSETFGAGGITFVLSVGAVSG
jgi:hypothetical protein